MQLLILRGRILDSLHNRLQLRLRVLEFVMEPDDLIECRRLLFRLACLIEKCEKLFCAGHGLGSQCDRLRLFGWDREVPARLHSLLCTRPPAFPFRLRAQIATQQLSDWPERASPLETSDAFA